MTDACSQAVLPAPATPGLHRRLCLPIHMRFRSRMGLEPRTIACNFNLLAAQLPLRHLRYVIGSQSLCQMIMQTDVPQLQTPIPTQTPTPTPTPQTSSTP